VRPRVRRFGWSRTYSGRDGLLRRSCPRHVVADGDRIRRCKGVPDCRACLICMPSPDCGAEAMGAERAGLRSRCPAGAVNLPGLAVSGLHRPTARRSPPHLAEPLSGNVREPTGRCAADRCPRPQRLEYATHLPPPGVECRRIGRRAAEGCPDPGAVRIAARARRLLDRRGV
jgi:hypothetical protein